MAKRQIKNALDRVGKRLGFRVLTDREQRLWQQREQDLVAQLHDVYVGELFSDLPTTPRRLELLRNLIGTSISEGMYLLHSLATAPEGDVCEFGVAQGATSALLADAILESRRHLWLYDSFEGLSPPTEEDELIDDIFGMGSIERYAGAMANPRESVEKRLASIGFPADRVHIIEGFLDAAEQRLPETVGFAYLDFDFFEPTITALRLLDDRLAEHGRIVVDDYGFFSSGIEKAVQQFVLEQPRYTLQVAPKHAGHFCILTA